MGPGLAPRTVEFVGWILVSPLEELGVGLVEVVEGDGDTV